MANYKVAGLGEIDELTDGRMRMRPVRHHFGITAFGVNAFSGLEAGDTVINEHDEANEQARNEELYVVLRGRARFEVGDETIDAPQGTFVFVEPDARRAAFAEEAGTTVLAIGGVAGKPYDPRGWEVWAPAHALYEAGEYDAAIEQSRERIEASPYGVPLYNLACCESLSGRTADAIRHLRASLELRPSLRDLAKEDTDFDPIRDEATFKELVG